MAARDDDGVFPRYSPALEHAAQLRREARQVLAAALEMWRDCDRPACRRARRCHRDDGACVHAWFRSLDDEERADLYKEVRSVAAEKLAEEHASGPQR